VLPPEAIEDGKRVPYSEVERRANFFEVMEASPENIPRLKDLVTECLANAPKSRPSSEEVMDRLKSIVTENEVGSPCSEDIQRALDILKKAEERRTTMVSYTKRYYSLAVTVPSKNCILQMKLKGSRVNHRFSATSEHKNSVPDKKDAQEWVNIHPHTLGLEGYV
jgi:serine/threonine protein kinase